MTRILKTDRAKAENKNENHLHANEARWFAVYTGYKREKRVVSLLNKKGICAYVPLQKLTRYYTSKVKKVAIPLISCYVFVKIVQSEYVTVLETQFVQRFLKINQNLLAIPQKEIDLLRRIVGEQVEIEVDTAFWKQGDKVEVIAGQLTGLQGTLVEKRGEHKLIVTLNTLGYDLMMEIKPELLRKLPPNSVLV
ncbi:MAG: UpxY family transcription antiterminator [Bacteroidota bacterium]